MDVLRSSLAQQLMQSYPLTKSTVLFDREASTKLISSLYFFEKSFRYSLSNKWVLKHFVFISPSLLIFENIIKYHQAFQVFSINNFENYSIPLYSVLNIRKLKIMRKLIVICPHYPPKASGVGDYVHMMSSAWAKLYDEVFIFTEQKNPVSPLAKNIRVESCSINQLTIGIYHTIKNDCNDADVLFQFTPNLYARAGMNFKLLLGLIVLRSAGIKYSFYFHEKQYPLSFNPKDVILGSLQFIIYSILKLSSHKSIYSYADMQRIGIGEYVVPVCSNMPEIASMSGSPVSTKYHLNKFFMYFGTTHPSKCLDWVIKAYNELSDAKKSEYPLIIVGTKQEDLPLKPICARNPIKCLGYLPAEEVSQLLTEATLVLSPYIDGISSRRGSTIGAICNGASVVSNLGRNSNLEFPWEEFMLVSSEASFESYRNKFLLVCENISSYSGLSSKAREAYLKYFAHDILATKIRDILNMPDSLI